MDISAFARLATTTFADVLTRDRVMDPGIRPLWGPMERLAGPAYPVACPAGDNLMLHVAIHRAPAGSVIVCAAGDSNWAMAGGNVCAYAQQRSPGSWWTARSATSPRRANGAFPSSRAA